MVMQHYHRLVTYTSAFALPLLPNVICLSNMSTNRDFYRADGVRITHDPYAPGMAEKYGTPGNTDNEGFDPYADTVGAGIYGGIVKRDDDCAVVIGRQYQNHNPRPGPVYAGGGYAPSTRMLEDVNELITLVEKYPDLAVDITTGGAQPLHMCGMLKRKQLAVKALVERGADIEALDTYGMTPLHRMASNNLAEGAKMLLEAGADVFNTGKIGETAFDIARSSAARDVLKVLDDHAAKGSDKKSTGSKANVVKISVMGSNNPDVNGVYIPKSASDIPTGFDKVCKERNWDTLKMWKQLNGQSQTDTWFAHLQNDSYIYWNKSDKTWWIDGPDGMGVWIAQGSSHSPPGRGWRLVSGDNAGEGPVVLTHRKLI
jgi:hypothetical protein